jgi:hypothetical protein
VGQSVEIRGWAWSFRGVAAVEVSVDGAATFSRVELGPRRDWAWQPFSWSWRPTDPGVRTLSVRAIDVGGLTQPADGARNAIHTVTVTVADRQA